MGVLYLIRYGEFLTGYSETRIWVSVWNKSFIFACYVINCERFNYVYFYIKICLWNIVELKRYITKLSRWIPNVNQSKLVNLVDYKSCWD